MFVTPLTRILLENSQQARETRCRLASSVYSSYLLPHIAPWSGVVKFYACWNMNNTCLFTLMPNVAYTQCARPLLPGRDSSCCNCCCFRLYVQSSSCRFCICIVKVNSFRPTHPAPFILHGICMGIFGFASPLLRHCFCIVDGTELFSDSIKKNVNAFSMSQSDYSHMVSVPAASPAVCSILVFSSFL